MNERCVWSWLIAGFVMLGSAAVVSGQEAENASTRLIQMDFHVFRLDQSAQIETKTKPDSVTHRRIGERSILSEPDSNMLLRALKKHAKGVELIASPRLVTADGYGAFLQTDRWNIEATPRLLEDDYTIKSELEITATNPTPPTREAKDSIPWSTRTTIVLWEGQSVVLGNQPPNFVAKGSKKKKSSSKSTTSETMVLVTVRAINPAGSGAPAGAESQRPPDNLLPELGIRLKQLYRGLSDDTYDTSDASRIEHAQTSEMGAQFQEAVSAGLKRIQRIGQKEAINKLKKVESSIKRSLEQE